MTKRIIAVLAAAAFGVAVAAAPAQAVVHDLRKPKPAVTHVVHDL